MPSSAAGRQPTALPVSETERAHAHASFLEGKQDGLFGMSPRGGPHSPDRHRMRGTKQLVNRGVGVPLLPSEG
jgi:hypothetical protein